jgi:hypothetical protein
MPPSAVLEIKAALAGRFGQRADASLVLVAAAVEHHRGDAGRLGLGGQLGPDPAAAFLSPSPAEVGEPAAASVRPAWSSMSWA